MNDWIKPWMVTAPAALVVGGDLCFESAWRVSVFLTFVLALSTLVFPIWFLFFKAER